MKDDEKKRNLELAEKLLSEQNFVAAVIGGAVATLLAAGAYGMTVTAWAYSHGFAVAGIGIVIGITMQFLGRGIETKFAVAATLYALSGCVLGNLFRVAMQQAQASSTHPIDILGNTAAPILVEWSVKDLSLVDLVYWFVAVVCAVFLARRPLSRVQRLAIGTYELGA